MALYRKQKGRVTTSMKKDIGQNLVYTTGKALMLLANLRKHEFTLSIRKVRVVNDYSKNNFVYAFRKIKEFQPYRFGDRSIKQIEIIRSSASEPFPLILTV